MSEQRMTDEQVAAVVARAQYGNQEGLRALHELTRELHRARRSEQELLVAYAGAQKALERRRVADGWRP